MASLSNTKFFENYLVAVNYSLVSERTGAHSYGFNGQEKDDEVAGAGNTNTAAYWEYDTRLGRRWNLDPIKKPWQSDYATFSDSPIWKTDPNGDDDFFNSDGSYSHSTKTGTSIKIITHDGIKDFSKYKVYDVNTLHTISNIATYYAKQVGLTNAVGGKPNVKDPAFNPAFTLMNGKNFKGMYLNIKGGYVADFIYNGDDLSSINFNSPLKDGSVALLKVIISPLGDPLLPNVYNLAFGIPLANGDIDDKIKLRHANLNKTFSTILLYSLAYLEKYPNVTIGLDGSNDIRAYLYHRMFISNRVYLSGFFIAIGVDWYVKLLRNRDNVERNAQGHPIFKPKAEPFDYERKTTDLYRYYMYHRKS